MPVDWSVFLPVICVEKGTKYEGECYMERIREVVKINGRPVSISDNLSKSDFQTGDIVIISFHKSIFPEKKRQHQIVLPDSGAE